MKLKIDYCQDSDTLSLWNGQPASTGDDVADYLVVDYDSAGDAVGFTLENAAELLLPILMAAKEKAAATAEGDN